MDYFSFPKKEKIIPTESPQIRLFNEINPELELPFGHVFAKFVTKDLTEDEVQKIEDKQADSVIYGTKVSMFPEETLSDTTKNSKNLGSYSILNKTISIASQDTDWKRVLLHEAFHGYYDQYRTEFELQLATAVADSKRVSMEDGSFNWDRMEIIEDFVRYALLQSHIADELLATLASLQTKHNLSETLLADSYKKQFVENTVYSARKIGLDTPVQSIFELPSTDKYFDQQKSILVNLNVLCTEFKILLTQIETDYKSNRPALMKELQELATTLLRSIKDYKVDRNKLKEILGRFGGVHITELEEVFQINKISVTSKLVEILNSDHNPSRGSSTSVSSAVINPDLMADSIFEVGRSKRL